MVDEYPEHLESEYLEDQCLREREAQRAPLELYAEDGDPTADLLRCLVEEGAIEWRVEEDGEIRYRLTEIGRRFAEDLERSR